MLGAERRAKLVVGAAVEGRHTVTEDVDQLVVAASSVSVGLLHAALTLLIVRSSRCLPTLSSTKVAIDSCAGEWVKHCVSPRHTGEGAQPCLGEEG